MNNMIIWGAGRLGICALHYYCDYYNIVCFVDSNSSKWGTYVDDVIVQSPDYIKKESDSIIVVASKNSSEEIIEQLKLQFGIKDVYVFNATSRQAGSKTTEGICVDDAICIRLFGGLGNQMFQYALLCALRAKGRRVYVRNMNYGEQLGIKKVFPNVSFDEITFEDEKTIIPINVEKDEPNKIICYYKENLAYGIIKKADLSLLGIDSGIIQGLFQTTLFPEMAKFELTRDFMFSSFDNCMNDVVADICNSNSVSIHIRRGDYLSITNKHFYGNICTEDYYLNAINYIRDRIDKPVFYVFSNNIEEAKQIIREKDVVFIDGESIDGYEDWIDMYMMSQCKHNIIANSTFSWWGAWLNQNDEKIVIAPSKWINTFTYKDIYPHNWITIGD